MRMVAHQSIHGRLRQEQLAQAAATPSPDRDQAQYLRDQLAHRFKHVRSERDPHFVQEEELPAHIRLLSSKATKIMDIQSGQ